MEKRVLGKSGINASNIGLGTYYFGGGDGTSPPSSKDIIDMIHSALDHSINLLDTAPSYGFGHCEKIIGKDIFFNNISIMYSLKSDNVNSLRLINKIFLYFFMNRKNSY